MSLGDLVISLSANTASLQSDMGKANQILERFASKSIQGSKQAEAAIAQLGKAGVTSVDRLKLAFDNLNIKTALQIENEKARMIASFEQIKNSGVASSNEIKRAFSAMNDQLDKIDGKDPMGSGIRRMNTNLFVSIAMIAKMQIMFSLINTTMSAIGRLPGVAVEAIENYNATIVGNAAMITSMQKGIKDIGQAYKENKAYSTASLDVLIKMDAETAASAKNLNDMNSQFIQQGIILDVNNKKQIEGFKAVANALAAITANDPNKDMQFAQEIRAMRDFQDKGSNRLVQMLAAQGVTKEMVNDWKKIGAETNNHGYALEKLLPYLQGFAAAQGDINNLWTTVKSTMVTIRDEVLRGGLSQGFAEIVEKMKEISKYAKENKEKVQAFLRDGFQDVKIVAGLMWDIGKGVAYISEPLMWAAIAAGIYKGVTAMRAFAVEMTIATGGMNLLIAGAATLGLYGVKEFRNAKAGGDRVNAIKDLAGPNNQFKMGGLTVDNLNKILQQQPLATNEDIVKWRTTPGALSWGANGSNFNMNTQMIDWLKASSIPSARPPKNINVLGTDSKTGSGSGTDSFSQVMSAWERLNVQAEQDPFKRKLMEINNDFASISADFESSSKKAELATKGITASKIEEMRIQAITRAFEEEATASSKKALSEEIAAIKLKIAEERKALEEAKKARQEKAALAEAAIQDQIEQINLEERLNKISGPEAIARRLPLEREIVNIRKELLMGINSSTDPAAWRTAFRAVTSGQSKVLEDIKLQYDRTFKGGAENAMKSISESAANTGEQIQGIFKNAFESAVQSLMEFTRTGKFEFGKFTISILEMIQKIALEKAMAGIVGNLMGGFGSMFSSPVNTGVLAGSGSGMPASVGGYQGINIPKLATGTNYVPADMLAIIHKGEAVVPAPFNNGGGNASNIKIELVNQTGKEMKQKDGGMKFDGKNMIKTIILEAMDSDYSFRNAVRGG